MIQPKKLEDLIREKMPFTSPDSRGFYSHRCQVCNDYKVRAGFKFDGGVVGFNCWNCGSTGRYEEFSGKISNKMRRILNAYDISDNEINDVINSAFFSEKKQEEKITLSSLKKVNTSTPTIKLPEKSFRLGCAEHLDLQQPIVDYLVGRKIDILKYPFFFSLQERFKNKVIIPFYRSGKLIYWQARSIIPGEKSRYDNAPVGRDAVMFNIDEINHFSKLPLFVVEGVFDAMTLHGVATLGSQLSEAKLELLSKSPRRLIFVIDKDKNGAHVAEKVLERGWEIAFAPDGAEDINKSAQRFGLIWTINEVMKSVVSKGDEAELMIRMRCGNGH